MKAETILRALLDTTEDELQQFLNTYNVDEDRMITELMKAKHGEAFVVGEQGTTSIGIADLEKASVFASIESANSVITGIKDELKERQEKPELIGQLARLNLRDAIMIDDKAQKLFMSEAQYSLLEEQAPNVLEIVEDSTPYQFAVRGR